MWIFALVSTCFIAACAQNHANPKEFIELLPFKRRDFEDAFNSLDLDGDGFIQVDDMAKHYFHENAQFARNKIIKLMDSEKTPGKISPGELATFICKDSVKLSVHDCVYISNKRTRMLCLADEILTFVYLVMDEKAIQSFFTYLESKDPKDGLLDIEEILALQHNNQPLSQADADNLLKEIGAGKQTINLNDFTEYIMRQDPSFLFRECRKSEHDHGFEYDNACLLHKLINYTSRHLTEYLKTLVFHKYDVERIDHVLEADDIKLASGGTDTEVNSFINILDISGEGVISYGEFRGYISIPSVKHQLETDCLHEKMQSSESKVLCLKRRLWEVVVKDNHRTAFIGIGDLDWIFIFEELDTSNDGKIEKKNDLESGSSWKPGIAERFIDDIVGSSMAHVSLEDFIRYISEPNMVYGLADCQLQMDGSERIRCYIREFVDMLTNMLSKIEVTAFFKYYESIGEKVITKDELAKVGLTDEKEQTKFLINLGMGDTSVTRYEFNWFVRQQEPSRLFTTEDDALPKHHFPTEQLHEKLSFYVSKRMTEFDIFNLFSALDKNKNNAIDKTDIRGVIDVKTLKAMLVFSKFDEGASILEFWLYMNAKVPDNKIRKQQLEKECTQLVQDELIRCYKRVLKTIA